MLDIFFSELFIIAKHYKLPKSLSIDRIEIHKNYDMSVQWRASKQLVTAMQSHFHHMFSSKPFGTERRANKNTHNPPIA